MPVSIRPTREDGQSMDFTIEPLDDHDKKTQMEHQLHCLRRLSYWGSVCLFVDTVYFAYRAKCSIDGGFNVSWLELIIAWSFLGLEISLEFPNFLTCVGAVSCLKKLRMRPLLRLVGDNVPTVDILIPCCGENLEVIRDTIRAACTLHYPRERYRVILLDDGNSVELQHEVDVLKKTDPRMRNLFYTCRGVKVVTHSKAANLNYGLSFLKDLGPAEYIAVLDVDMIPVPIFLRALLPHLLNDSSMAMSTGPQCFYNIPDGDPLGQGLDAVFNISLLYQDTSSNGMCTGTGFVLRRSAIEEVGGIPLEELNEDVMTSLMLHANGWKVANVWESLQWGLVPDSAAGHAKQVARWELGIASVVIALWGPRLTKLSDSQRFQYLAGLVAIFATAVSLTIAMLLVPAIFISGKPLIVNAPQQLGNLMMLSALQLLVVWLNGLFTADATGFRTPIWPPYRTPFLAPFQSAALIGLLFPSIQNFTPSGSVQDGERERKARSSKSLLWRLKILVGDFRLWIQLLIILSITYGVILAVKETVGMDNQRQQLSVSVLWPSACAHWMMFIVECWKPISYAIFPPKLQPREMLLNRDRDTKIAYPSETAKSEKRTQPPQSFSLIILAYVVLVLAYTWAKET